MFDSSRGIGQLRDDQKRVRQNGGQLPMRFFFALLVLHPPLRLFDLTLSLGQSCVYLPLPLPQLVGRTAVHRERGPPAIQKHLT